MKIVLSPAKSLDYQSDLPTRIFTRPAFIKEAKKIQSVLKKQKPADLSNLMHISDKLAHLNWTRNKERKFTVDEITFNTRQAIFAFNGDVYEGLDAYTLTGEQLEFLQQNLRILSGLYGYLKPLDLIEPYRLEMGTKLAVGEAKDLYAFWKPVLVKKLQAELEKNEVLVNLASNEYFSAINTKLLKHQLITPEFKECKNGHLKTISFFAKKARGLMVRYIADNKITDPEALKNFTIEGYQFDENLSNDKKWIFTR